MAIQPAVINGAYTIAWDGANDLGNTENGFTIRVVPYFEEIRSDAGGDSLLNGIHRGADVFVDFDYLDYKELMDHDVMMPVVGTTDPPRDATGYVENYISTIGAQILAHAKVLVLAPLAISGGNAKNTYTFHKAYPISDFTTLLSMNFRRGPMTFQIFPDASQEGTATNRYVAITTAA